MQVASSTFARTLLPKPAHHSRRLTARSVPGSNGLSGDGCGGTSSLFIGRTVIQGEVVESKDTVVVLGDCQPGSRVCSEQNIIVMGRCAAVAAVWSLYCSSTRVAVRVFSVPASICSCKLSVLGILVQVQSCLQVTG